MAEHVYDAKKQQRYKTLDEKFNGWKLFDIYTNEQGLKIGVYYRLNEDGNISYTLVNAGSTIKIFEDFPGVWNDWGNNNFTQPFGFSLDMKDSISYAEMFVQQHPDSHITFVGHSKGGAEAAANAVATNKNAILFNPATVNLSAYGLRSDDYDADMTAYIVEGEILNNIFGAISKPIDKKQIIKEDNFWMKLFKITPAGHIYDFVESILDHFIDTVIKTLEG